MFVQNESFDKYFKDMESDFVSQFKSVENVNYLDKSYRNADSKSRRLADRMIERLLESGSILIQGEINRDLQKGGIFLLMEQFTHLT